MMTTITRKREAKAEVEKRRAELHSSSEMRCDKSAARREKENFD